MFYRFALASLLKLLAGLEDDEAPAETDRVSSDHLLFCLLQWHVRSCFNFLCFYTANHYINSGLESVLLSMAILFNAINGVRISWPTGHDALIPCELTGTMRYHQPVLARYHSTSPQ
ncbi:hypothetical protein P4S72_02935 [Vibrio sp. PP-XX7]